MAKQPAVLIVGGGILATYMIRQAQALGLYVICTDGDDQCLGGERADEFMQIDTYDVQGHREVGQFLRYSQGREIRGVTTCGSDVAPSVAAAAQAAGVRGIPVEVAERTHNKAIVREVLDEAGLECYQPRWVKSTIRESAAMVLISSDAFSEEILREFERGFGIRLPCIIKPVSQRASRGITIVHERQGFTVAEQKVLAYGDTYLTEELLTGTEHSAELILGNEGETLWWNIVDRYFDYSSGIPLETGHVNPTRLGEHEQQQILLMTLAAARALGVTWGPFKIDCMMTTEGPKILECTARLSGGFDSQATSPMTGRHPMRLLLQLACGLKVEPQLQMHEAQGYAACAAVMPQKTGVVRRLPKQYCIVWIVGVGDTVSPLEHNAQRCGYVLTTGKTYDYAWERARARAGVAAERMEIE